jgi:7-cyano-7-deazaguanine synthase in queuosine biosynthesis
MFIVRKDGVRPILFVFYMEKKKILLLFSAGKESVLNAYKLRKQDVLLLLYDYGQKSFPREYDSMAYYANLYGFSFLAISLKGLVHIPPAIRDGVVGDTHVPVRNFIFITLAINYAEGHGYKEVAIGSYDYTKEEGFNDGHVAVVHELNWVLKPHTKVLIVAPLKKNTWHDTVKELVSKKVDLSHLWSCESIDDGGRREEGGYYNCGKCSKCVKFIKTLEEHKKISPLLTRYKNYVYGK